ncbi:MAG: response regulator transcription factor [Candidatus Promineifilaceae bacterium]|nr:response regulator transcription factor [Candidatus Promineifilaceae bacterium]
MAEDTDTPPAVLAVDDSMEALQIVRHTLEEAGFVPVTASSGEEAVDEVAEKGLPHLAVVDLKMPPGMDGFEFCDYLYQFSDVPVVMLTGVDESETVVQALQQYAEDYVLKPFNPDELVARVRRVLARVGRFPYRMSVPIVVDDCLRIDFPSREVMVEDRTASLTPTEARLLYILMRTPGKTVTSDFLLRRMWPMEHAYEDRLHVYIHRLRSKLQVGRGEHPYVVSERGVGYRFQPLRCGSN